MAGIALMGQGGVEIESRVGRSPVDIDHVVSEIIKRRREIEGRA